MLGYIQYATASDIFKIPKYLERFLLWHIKVYLGIFSIFQTYLDILVTLRNFDIFRTLTFSKPCQTCTMTYFAKMF